MAGLCVCAAAAPCRLISYFTPGHLRPPEGTHTISKRQLRPAPALRALRGAGTAHSSQHTCPQRQPARPTARKSTAKGLTGARSAGAGNVQKDRCSWHASGTGRHAARAPSSAEQWDGDGRRLHSVRCCGKFGPCYGGRRALARSGSAVGSCGRAQPSSVRSAHAPMRQRSRLTRATRASSSSSSSSRLHGQVGRCAAQGQQAVGGLRKLRMLNPHAVPAAVVLALQGSRRLRSAAGSR